MAIKNTAITVCYVAWNTSTNSGQTGDSANHTLKLVQDGSENNPTNNPAQVDSVNAPGVYSLALTAGDMNFNCVVLCGKSSTANVSIIPLVIVTERGNIATGAAPGAASGLLIAGTNAATTINALTLTGAAAVTSTPATAGLTITGGAASTTSGGTSAAAIIATGGAGAASTNGSAAGVTFTAGGTTTVSGNDGFKTTATGNGNGVTFAHAGSGLDLNATTSPPLNVNVTQYNGHTAVTDANNYPSVNIVDISGTASTGAGGFVGIDWSQIHTPSATVALSGTTIATVTNQLTGAAIATSVWQDATAGDFNAASSIGKSLYTSGNAPGAASGLALVGSNMGTVSSVTGSVGSISGVTFPTHFSSLVINASGLMQLDLTETLSAARALDSIADTSLTLNDALQCAVAGVTAQIDASGGTSMTFKTASTATLLRTKTLTLISPPSTVPDKAV